MRKAIGAKLEGDAGRSSACSRPIIRAPQLRALLPGKPAWLYLAVNPRRCGTMFAIDGRETWLVHNHLNPDEPDFDSIDRDWAIREILGVGPDFEYEVISQGRLGRPPPRGRPLPRPAASSSPAMPRISGCRTPATA